MMSPEGTDRVRINRKRAEGRDNSDKPKTLKLKARRLNPVNTTCYVQILGTGMDTHDTSPSVLLFFDKQRFIFNAGEGLQRFCTEHKIKLSKVDHIFLSRVCSENAGGLPGLLLTLAGMGDEGMSVNIWGPLDLKFLVGAMKSFIPKAAMVHSHSFGPIANPDGLPIPDHQKCIEPIVLIDDEVVKLSAILLRPSHLKEDRDHSPEPLLLHSPKRKAGSLVKPGDFSVMYVCELPEIKGRFDPEKALALGLKAGPKYRELQLGNSVVSDLDKYIMVHPENVMDPSIPGPIVFLVDCPTESHLQELLSIHYLNCYYTNFSGNPPEHAKTVSCVIHLSPASVTSSINYQKWMNRFGAAQHIMAGHQMKNVKIPILQSSARIAARLNYLCPRFFPSPVFCSPEQYDDSSPDSTASSEVHKLCETIPSENLLKFHLRPYAQLGLDRSGIPCMKAPSEIIDELLSEIPEIVDAAQQVSRFWQDPRELEEDPTPMQGNGVMIKEPWLNLDTLPSCLENINRKDMEIVLLGTGSSQPSKYRNVSSIYINLFSKGGFLLDCGEGTLGQLKRRYGVEGADNSVRGLKCIWISHIHADHHAGIARILTFRRDLLKGVSHEPLLVVGPTQLKGFLDAYQRLEDLDMKFLNCLNTMDSLDAFEGGANSNNSCSSMKSLKNVLSESGLEALISFPVVHCLDAFGVVLKAAERINNVGKVIPGWKIVYSGDTRPCTKLIEASCGATVLIHEATFEDALMEDAISKNHSTTNEAIQVGDSAGAYRIILTHFSQRYPKIPVIDESHMNKTCIAFDMMSVNLADLHILPKLLPHIKLLFKQEMIVDESDVLGGI